MRTLQGIALAIPMIPSGIARSQSLTLFPLMRAARRESVAGAPRRGRNSLAVDLPQVELAGALCAPEDGTKASERSSSEVNWL